MFKKMVPTLKLNFVAVSHSILKKLLSFIIWATKLLKQTLITDIFGCRVTQRKSEMTSYLNNGYDVMNCFAN